MGFVVGTVQRFALPTCSSDSSGISGSSGGSSGSSNSESGGVSDSSNSGSSLQTVITTAGANVESVVPALGGYLASEMNTTAPGQIRKYNMDGTLDESFTPISAMGNIGLAISSDEAKLFVAVMNGVSEFDLTASGGTLVRTIDVSAHTSMVNGLCLSSDGSILYATETGWTFNQTTFQIYQKETSARLMAITLADGTVESLLPDMTPDHSPNGCVVHPDNSNLVYMANMWHGVTAWDRVNGNVEVSWGANIVTNTRMQMANRWGDGIVYHCGMIYVSSFGFDLSVMASAGNIWSCDPTGQADCDVLTPSVGADIQLDTRGSGQPYVLLPQMGFVVGTVQRFALPTCSSGSSGLSGSSNSGSSGGSSGISPSVSLSMALTVDDPAAFVALPTSQAAVEAGIASAAVVDASTVSATLTVARRLQEDSRLRRLEGEVNVDAIIQVDDAAAASTLTDSVNMIEADEMASAVNNALTQANINAAVSVTQLEATHATHPQGAADTSHSCTVDVSVGLSAVVLCAAVMQWLC